MLRLLLPACGLCASWATVCCGAREPFECEPERSCGTYTYAEEGCMCSGHAPPEALPGSGQMPSVWRQSRSQGVDP